MTPTDADRTAPGRAPARSGRYRLPRTAVAAIIVVTVAVAGIVFYSMSGGGPDAPRFEVRDQGTGEAYYSRPVEVGETFTLEHTHSVTRRLVVETFSVLEADTIAIEEMWFDQNGPNLPTGPEQLGDGETTFIYEDDGSFRVVHHSFPLGTVPLLIGSESVDHTLTFADGDRVRLLDIAERGTTVELTVHPG